MILDITFNVGDGTLVFEDTTTVSSTGFDGTVTVIHPDGFAQSIAIDETGDVSIDLREDSDDEYLRGNYTISYINDEGVDESIVICFDYVAPTVKIGCNVDYLCSKLTVTDLTSYNISGVTMANTSIVRSHVVAYPNATGLANINANTQIVVVSPIYTGTFTSIISSTVTWTLPNYTIVDVLTGNMDCDVDGNNQLCALTCCMKEAYKRWNNARCAGRRADEFEANFRQVASIATLAYVSLSCGKVDDVTDYVNMAKTLSGCKDCDCSDGSSGELVVALCGAGVTGEVDVTAGTGITISEGGVISVDQSWLTNFVNNLILSLDISEIEAQVAQNKTDIANIAGILAAAGIDLDTDVEAIENQVEAINTSLANHRLLSFSYSFRWQNGVLVDNRDIENRVISQNVVIMNGSTGLGFFARPKVVWIAADSGEPAEFEVELFAQEGILPDTVLNNLNIQCNVASTSAGSFLTARIKPFVHTIGTNDLNTDLKFKVWFWYEDTGTFVTQAAMSAGSTTYFGGSAFLSFDITGKNA